MSELKKCPFCGSEAETFEASEDSFSILCTGCGVETPYLPYLTEAVAAWNRRADAVPVVRGEWFDRGSLSCRCSECGCKSNKEYTYCPNCGAKMESEGST